MHAKHFTQAAAFLGFLPLNVAVIFVIPLVFVLLPSVAQAQQQPVLGQEGVVESALHKTNDLKDNVVETVQSLPAEGRGLWADVQRMGQQARDYVQAKTSALCSRIRQGLYAMRQNREGLIAQQNKALISHNSKDTKSNKKK
jgi:hypothetical protein